MSSWTTEAHQRWDHIPADTQERILTSVWCPHCGAARRISLDGGRRVANDVVLTGSCTVCGHRMARLLEYEFPPMPVATDPSFQLGESVIWRKRLPGGPYVSPRTATVIAITPKRIKIMADDDGEYVTRFVSRERLQRRT